MDGVESITAATSEGSSHERSIPRLPVEVCERIIDHVAIGLDLIDYHVKGQPHLVTLTSCALVCRDWYYLTWYHLRQRIRLRDREDVLSLSKTLRAKPRLHEVVQQVVISGASPGERKPIRHLGTFAAMLAGRAPNLIRINIEHAEWTTGLVRTEDINYMAAFSSLDTLVVRFVTLSSVSQLSRLLSALPRLSQLACVFIDCLQKQQVSPASLSLNCANMVNLRVVSLAPAVEDLLLQISRASRVRRFSLAVDGELDPSSAASRSQTLLDASATSAETVELVIAPDYPVRDGTVEATVERHCNLSHYDHLWSLEIVLYDPFAAWPWIPHILSHIVSKHFQTMCVMLVLRRDHAADGLDGMLTTMGQDDVLARLDSILQEKRFCSTVASRGICLSIYCSSKTWTSDDELVDSALRERYDRWDELVRQRMPYSHGQGILSTMHSFAEIRSWTQDMKWIHHTRMQAEQTSEGSSHGPPISRLPVDVYERIIDNIAAGLDIGPNVIEGEPLAQLTTVATLTSCALVCRDWSFLTWYYLHRIISLRDRNEVLLLSKILRQRPRIREVIQEVVISGAPGGRQSIRHLGTFAAMLAGKAPRLSRITIEDAEWTIGSVRMEDIGYLAAFSSIDTLHISRVTLSSVTQLSRLVSALPQLRKLWCANVNCLQKQQVSPASSALNCASLECLEVRWVAPAVEDLFVQISRASRVRFLDFGVDSKLDSSSVVSRSQNLLDASSTSAETIVLDFNFDCPVCDGAIDAMVERHYNLSRHEHLWELRIWLYHPSAAWPWIPHILSRITSKRFQAMSVMLCLRTDHTTDELDGMLMTMEQDDVLARLDSILQGEHFCSTVASRGICLSIHDGSTWKSDDEIMVMDSALRKRYGRWDELVRQRMPYSHGQGILSTVHNLQEFNSWRADMEGIRTSIPAEQTNVEEEARSESEGQDDEGPRGGTD